MFVTDHCLFLSVAFNGISTDRETRYVKSRESNDHLFHKSDHLSKSILILSYMMCYQMITISYTLSYNYKKSTSRAFPPKKCVPQQFPAGLGIFRKFILAWRFEQFEEHHFFYNILIFTIISENNYLKID